MAQTANKLAETESQGFGAAVIRCYALTAPLLPLVNRLTRGRFEIAPDKGRAVILTAIARLREQQMEANRQAIFGGWTREAERDRAQRSDRIAALLRELAGLDGSPR